MALEIRAAANMKDLWIVLAYIFRQFSIRQYSDTTHYTYALQRGNIALLAPPPLVFRAKTLARER